MLPCMYASTENRFAYITAYCTELLRCSLGLFEVHYHRLPKERRQCRRLTFVRVRWPLRSTVSYATRWFNGMAVALIIGTFIKTTITS